MTTIGRWLRRFFRPPRAERIALGRRTLLFSALAGVGGALLVKTEPLGGGRAYSPSLIRPPGSLPEKDFLAKCVRCGECMKVCPTNVIQPAWLAGGAEGVWTPVLNMDIGYCEYECTLCGQVCPTGAIRPLSLEEKYRTRMGLAHFDRSRCLPWAYARSCIVCEEHCPIPDKAIWLRNVEVVDRSGQKIALQQPHVDASKCVGCGICQNKCPMSDRAAILVTSVGETRHPENQILLSDGY